MSEPINAVQLDVLDSEGFYEVMQRYRWAGLVRGGSREEDIIPAFEAVKDWIRAYRREALEAEIERLTRLELNTREWLQEAIDERDRLRAAMERIANSESPWHTPGSPTDAVVEIAREALGETKP